jgi:hypothetical protein
MVVHACNPSTPEAEVGVLIKAILCYRASLRPTGLCINSVSKKP